MDVSGKRGQQAGAGLQPLTAARKAWWQVQSMWEANTQCAPGSPGPEWLPAISSRARHSNGREPASETADNIQFNAIQLMPDQMNHLYWAGVNDGVSTLDQRPAWRAIHW